MQLTNHTEAMIPVMRLIKQYAPNTYEAMENAYWPVTLVAEECDLDNIMNTVKRGEVSKYEAMDIAGDINRALGLTLVPVDKNHPSPLSNQTWLNYPAIMRQAQRSHLDPARLAATVLVHEWTHRKGHTDEAPAYAAGAKFARLMGDERLAQNQEQTEQQVAAREQARERQIVGDPFFGLFGGLFR